MKWFWLLRNLNTKREAYVGDEIDIGRDPRDLRKPSIVHDWPEAAVLFLGPHGQDGPPDDAVQNAFSLDIHSPRLYEAVGAAGIRGWQYLPIELRRPTGSHGRFWLAHVTQCVDAIDMERSSISRIPMDFVAPSKRGLILSLDKLVLRRDSLGAHDVIRLCDYLPPVYVSQRFREVIRFGRYSGYDFEEIEVV